MPCRPCPSVRSLVVPPERISERIANAGAGVPLDTLFSRERVQRGAGEVRALSSGSPPECFSERITNTVVDAPLGFHVSQQRAQPRPFEARALSAGSPLEHVSERIMYSVVDVPNCARVSGCAEQVEQARSS